MKQQRYKRMCRTARQHEVALITAKEIMSYIENYYNSLIAQSHAVKFIDLAYE